MIRYMKLRSLLASVGVCAGVVGLSLITNQATATTPAGLVGSAVVSQGAFGTVKGRLVWGGASAPAPKKLEVGGQNAQACSVQLFDQALKVDAKNLGVEYGFAFLLAPKGTNPELTKQILEKSPSVTIDQKNCEFVPHSLAMLDTQNLVFTSSDAVGHNVHLTGFSNPGINTAVAPGGKLDVKLVPERRPSPVGLQCDIHPWMTGKIMVLNHPFFAVTKADGSFEITGIPAGTQNLIVFHEKVGYVNVGGSKGVPVEVSAGKTTDVGEVKVDPTKVK